MTRTVLSCTVSRTLKLAVPAALLLGSLAMPARAGSVCIDDFSDPSPEVAYVINLIDSDPTTVTTASAAVLGGEREINIDVLGVSRATSAVGEIGGGTYFSNTGSKGVVIDLIYDGIGAGSLGGADLVMGGNGKINLDFLFLDAGNATSVSIDVLATDSVGFATFSGSIGESAGAFSYSIPFASFVPAGGFGSFASINLLAFRINGLGTPNVDFELDQIKAVPEPSSLALAGLALAGLVVAARRRR